ncbi:unnamed protein product [Sphagnum troendelagicum]
MTLQNKLQGCLRAQGHEGTDPLFAGVNALVLEHFTIGLLSELQQQVRYEQAATFDEATKVAEKKEVNMEEVPRPTVQSMVKTVQFSTEPELRKHPEVSSRMESAMEQMINQMNQLSLLLQPRTMVKDVGSQKADITIGQLVAMVPLTQRELRKGLSTPKVPKVPTPLNAIAVERECDLIIDVQCNGSVLRGVLVDGGA